MMIVLIVLFELLVTEFIVDHNLAFSLSGPLLQLIKMAKSPEVIKKARFCPTKISHVLMKVVRPNMRARVVEHLRVNPFSLLVDESTDVQADKALAIVARTVYDGTIVSVLYRYMKVVDCTASGLFDSIISRLETDSIPIRNMTGFASD